MSDAPPACRPRLLIAARYIPPLVSGGSARPLMLAQQARSLGWDVSFVSPIEVAEFETVVVPHPRPEPPSTPGAGGMDLAARMRRALLWPDTDLRWSRRVADAVRRSAEAWDVVLTTSPPESLHLAGAVARRSGKANRWIADFRDGWLTSLARRRDGASQVAALIEGALLRGWLGQCDHGLAVNGDIAAQARRILRAPVEVLPHLPPLLFAPSLATPFHCAPGAPVLAHTGSFSLSEPTTDLAWVLETLAPAFAEVPGLHWHLMGRLTARERDLLAAPAWASRVTLHGPVAPHIARAAQQAADVLLAVNAPALDYPPGKLTEYRASGRPVLALGHPHWAEAVNEGEVPAARLARLARERVPDTEDPAIAALGEQVRAALARALGPG